jgi:hypothetical protein
MEAKPQTRESQPAPSPPAGEPQLEQFEDQNDPYAAWQAAMVDWKVDQKLQAHQHQQQLQQIQQTWQKKLDTFIADHVDYFDVTKQAEAPRLQVVADALIEGGPELVYHLAQSPEWREINRLPPAHALLRLGAVRATLPAPRPATSASGQAAIRQSVAKPIRPVGTAPVQTTPPLDDLPFDDYVREANRREREGRL